MNVSTATSLLSVIEEGEVFARQDGAARLWRLPDGCVVKQFRIKPFLSSATIRPPASRFVRAAAELERRGIRTIRVVRLIRLLSPRRDLVVYRPLEGETLREQLACRSVDDRLSVMERFAAFAATLHERGVYFRAMHFGNVIVMPDEQFGLIDIADCRFRAGPLRLRMRARNIRPMTAYSTDREALAECGSSRWMKAYASRAMLHPPDLEWLRSHLAALVGVP